MKAIGLILTLIVLAVVPGIIKAQDSDEIKLKLSGELLTDQRFLLEEGADWAWNENRLTLNLDKKIAGYSKLHGEIWLRNIGLPKITGSSDLYNKGIVDPFNIEIREAYVQIYRFLIKNLDLTIGRQRIAWGTADKLNPTDNLNPYDMEDILDFGRHRGSDAITMNYYFNTNYSLQGVFIPFFQPANMPVGIFANALNPEMTLPPGMVLKEFSDTVLTPRYNIGQSSSTGLKFKGFIGGLDFSLSYVYGLDGIPISTKNTFFLADTLGGININSQLSFARFHIIGADLATSLAGIGIWAEAAFFMPKEDVLMINDLTPLFPTSPVPIVMDSLILEKSKPYLKFVVGGDYFFREGSYLNIQYLHGFIHERGSESLNDYFMMRYEKKFFSDKLNVAPIGGAFIVADWKDIKNNYALAYMPEIAYQVTPNAKLSLSVALFDGKGDNLFAQLKDFNMFLFKFNYSL